MAEMDFSRNGSSAPSVYSWDEAVELWPTANIKISCSGSYFPTWPLEDFTSTHGVRSHGRQARMAYDDLIQAIAVYGQPLSAQS